MQALRRTLGFASQATARKPRVVVLGSGWGGNKVARYLDKSKFDVRVVSPANHFLFTPLLPSTAVGTLEFRAVQEPVRTIKGLGKYHQAKAQKLDVENRIVNCRDIFSGDTFDINYDFLVISAGCKTNTFAVPGVTQEQQSTAVWKSTSASGALMRPCWLGRAVTNRHHHAIEQASRRWRGGRRGDSARTRREF